ncbi:hypothetical protein [Arthrobacter phoenicis]|uniref:hypothetical protein n=1 Tax=Arthrobacter sp. 1P04AC-2 TaxID=3132261 RepID=UPI0039A2A3BA
MKPSYKFAMIAIFAVASLTACSPGIAQSAASAGDVAKSGASKADRPAGFTDNISVNGTLPADWQGGGGWRETTEKNASNVFAVGDYLAYIAGNKYEKGTGGTLTKAGHLALVDGKGATVYTSKEQTGFPVNHNSLSTVTKDGTLFLVYVESGLNKGKDDPNSLAKTPEAVEVSFVTVLDAKGKELYTKQIDGNVTVDSNTGDAVQINGKTNDPIALMDVSNGERTPVPPMAGYDWIGNFDGVNIYDTTSTPLQPNLTR